MSAPRPPPAPPAKPPPPPPEPPPPPTQHPTAPPPPAPNPSTPPAEATPPTTETATATLSPESPGAITAGAVAPFHHGAGIVALPGVVRPVAGEIGPLPGRGRPARAMKQGRCGEQHHSCRVHNAPSLGRGASRSTERRAPSEGYGQARRLAEWGSEPRRSGVGAGRQVPLVPGDPEHTVALRACQVGGMTLHRRPRAAHRAHHISVAPAARHVAGVAGTRHDGPAKRTSEDRFDQAPRHGHGLGCHLEDRLRSGHLDDAIPPPPSQPAVYVHAEPGPGDRQFLDGALHGGLHRPCHAGQP